jgi:hypothetical protein
VVDDEYPMPHSDLAQIQQAARECRDDLQAWQRELGLRSEKELRRSLLRRSSARNETPLARRLRGNGLCRKPQTPS